MKATRDFEIDPPDGRQRFAAGQDVPADVVKTYNLVEKGLVDAGRRTADRPAKD